MQFWVNRGVWAVESIRCSSPKHGRNHGLAADRVLAVAISAFLALASFLAPATSPSPTQPPPNQARAALIAFLTKGEWLGDGCRKRTEPYVSSACQRLDLKPNGTFSWFEYTDTPELSERGSWRVLSSDSSRGQLILGDSSIVPFWRAHDALVFGRDTLVHAEGNGPSDRIVSPSPELMRSLPSPSTTLTTRLWEKVDEFDADEYASTLRFEPSGRLVAGYGRERGAVEDVWYRVHHREIFAWAPATAETQRLAPKYPQQMELRGDTLFVDGRHAYMPSRERGRQRFFELYANDPDIRVSVSYTGSLCSAGTHRLTLSYSNHANILQVLDSLVVLGDRGGAFPDTIAIHPYHGHSLLPGQVFTDTLEARSFKYLGDTRLSFALHHHDRIGRSGSPAYFRLTCQAGGVKHGRK